METVKLTAETQRALMNAVRDTVYKVLLERREKWVTGDELAKTFGCFSKSWLKNYGRCLPRTQAIVNTPDGEVKSRWIYPINKIEQMIHDGKIQNLTL